MIPGTVMSKKPSDSPDRDATPAASKLVDEPISVVMPPRIVMNDSGIIALAGAKPRCAASTVSTGMKMTTTGVLLRIALRPIAETSVMTIARRAEPPAIRDTMRAGRSMASVANRP